MFAYIKGILIEKGNGYVVIEANGIGYKIFMSNISSFALGEDGNQVKVYTHYHVREDDISLYGFSTKEELKMFELLIGVSGVGAKSAISMLSVISPSDFALAVISNNINSLKKIPGIGVKTAQRIILELQDKLKNENMIAESNNEVVSVVKITPELEEAFSALQILGYNRRDIEKAFNGKNTEEMKLEEIIKLGLKLLSS
ncbi:MAG: Holliday junction branch migration protein RuvA [Clostridia bacterium]|nr:Holliday junction branch migration protein RuvA [Clostridia bacterium]